MTPPGRLWLIASRLMSCVEDTFTGAGVLLPTRRIVYGGGDIPADPDSPDTVPGLLAVGLVTVGQGMPGLPQAGALIPPAIMLSATFQVQLIRPASTLTADLIFPDDQTMTVDGLQFLGDAQQFHDAFIAARSSGQVAGAGQPIVLGGISPLPVEGGESGTVMTVTCLTTGPLT